MHGFSDPAGSADGSRKRRQRCCLPPFATTSAPRTRPISGLNSPACAYPYQRFAAPSRDTNAWLGATVDRYSFDVGSFISFSMPVYPGAATTFDNCSLRVSRVARQHHPYATEEEKARG